MKQRLRRRLHGFGILFVGVILVVLLFSSAMFVGGPDELASVVGGPDELASVVGGPDELASVVAVDMVELVPSGDTYKNVEEIESNDVADPVSVVVEQGCVGEECAIVEEGGVVEESGVAPEDSQEGGVDIVNDVKNDKLFTLVTVYFATNRFLVSKEGENHFSSERGDVSYGFCDVTVPRDHRMGDLETPDILKLEFTEDSSKHIILNSMTVMGKRGFFRDISSGDNEEELLLFVHGYNVSFKDAARRTAQLKYDLSFLGKAAFFSWPSYGEVHAYPADETNIKWSIKHLEKFIYDVASIEKIKSIYFVAHSMGNRGLVNALGNLSEKEYGDINSKFKTVILTAPDIDRDIFVEDIYPKINMLYSRITLYASSKDKALKASGKFHRNPRLGDTRNGIVVLGGIDSIDASSVSSDFLGHSYYATRDSVLSDMFYLVNGVPVSQRFGLEAVKGKGGNYWQFKNF